MPYHFSGRFYLKQILLLCLSAGVFLLISRYQPLDFFLSDLWFDTSSQQFWLRDNYWLAVVNHHYVKYGVIVVALATFFLGALLRKYHWMAVALIMVAGPSMVSLLKSFSGHSCPWDLARYGGTDYEYPLLGHMISPVAKGGCFPGGHASGGFGLLALYFLLYPISKRVAKWTAAFAVCLGLIMGYGQVMRGAHFFSHNLWSMWWVWSTQVALYYVYTTLYYRYKNEPQQKGAESPFTVVGK